MSTPTPAEPVRSHTTGTAIVSDIRTNDGGHNLMVKRDDDPYDGRVRIAVVDFQGTAKRGRTWYADDPEGRANAERLALCWNAHDDLVAALRAIAEFPVTHPGENQDAFNMGAIAV